jgi:hypothetical protein
MGAFVYTDPSNGFKLQVSPQFWVYFVVVVPMTIVLLVAWAVWINRRQLLSRGKKKYEEWFQGWQQQPTSPT